MLTGQTLLLVSFPECSLDVHSMSARGLGGIMNMVCSLGPTQIHAH